MLIYISPMGQDDVDSVSQIHAEQFPRQTYSELWVQSNFSAYPRIKMFVARNENNEIVGYIQWIHKSGFRINAVVELEQIAVSGNYQNKGVATQLIQQSLEAIMRSLEKGGCQLKTIIVSTRLDNHALQLYKKTLGVEVINSVDNLFSGTEVLMMKSVF